MLALGTGNAAAAEPRFGSPVGLTFEGGLQVALQPTASSATASIVLRLDRGYHDDPEDAAGAAHLVEHLWFRAVDDDVDVWTAFQERGCDAGAGTGPEETFFSATCPSGQATWMVQTFVRGLQDPIRGVGPAETAVEVAVIDQERRERDGAGKAVSRALYQALLPPDHPAHIAFVEPDFSLPSLDLDAARAVAAASYTPEHAVLAITGGFDAQAVRGVLEEAHGTARPRVVAPESEEASGPRQPPAKPVSTELVTVVQDQPTSTLLVAWNLPRDLGRSAAISIAAGHLGGALDRALRDEPEVLRASCSVASHPVAPALVCAVELDHQVKAGKSLQGTVMSALDDAWRKKGRRDLKRRLDRSRAEAPQDLIHDSVRASARARRFVSQLAAGEPLTPIEDTVARVKKWRPKGTAQFAQRWLTADRAAWVFVQSGVPTDAPDWEVAPAPVPSAAQRHQAFEADVPEMPSVRIARTQLPSGLVVYGIQREDSPYVMATVQLPGGIGAGPLGLTTLGEALSTGFGRSEAWGVRTHSRTHRDRVELWTVAPERQLFQAIDALATEVILRVPVVNAARERDEDLDRHVRRLRSALKGSRLQVGHIADDALTEAITPDHPPSRGPGLGELQAMRSIDAATIAAYLWRTYQPGHAVVIVSGPQEPEQIVKVAAKRFERFRLRQGIPPEPYPIGEAAGPPTPLAAVADAPAMGHASLRWRCRLPDAGSIAERRVLRRMVQEALWDDLRHQRGLTYTPWSSLSWWPDGTAQLDVVIDTVPERVGEALVEVEVSLAGLRDDPAGRLPTAVDREQRALVGRADSLEGIEALVFQAHRDGGTLADPLGWHRTQLDGVEAAALAEDLGACLDQAAWVVVGPAERTLPSLTEAGRTPKTLEREVVP